MKTGWAENLLRNANQFESMDISRVALTAQNAKVAFAGASVPTLK
jgi:hypothetical protein